MKLTVEILENTDYMISTWKDHTIAQGLKTEASITEPILDKPLVKCPQCDPLKDSAWIKREKLQEHIKTAHFGFW